MKIFFGSSPSSVEEVGLPVYCLMSQVSVMFNHLIYRNQFEAWSLSGQLRVYL